MRLKVYRAGRVHPKARVYFALEVERSLSAVAPCSHCDALRVRVAQLEHALASQAPTDDPWAGMTLAEVEARRIRAALADGRKDMRGVAKRLGIGATTLYRRLHEMQEAGVVA